ncbi:MAG: hypothetical protein RR620_07685 [Clostridium sp.]
MKYCKKCKKEFDVEDKKCPICGKKLDKILSDKEKEEIQKQNDDYTVIDTMFFM